MKRYFNEFLSSVPLTIHDAFHDTANLASASYIQTLSAFGSTVL
jgi:hypothetical protein